MNSKLILWQAKNKISNARMAEILGVHRSAIVRWRNGERTPRIVHVLKILEITDGEVPFSSWAANPGMVRGIQ